MQPSTLSRRASRDLSNLSTLSSSREDRRTVSASMTESLRPKELWAKVGDGIRGVSHPWLVGLAGGSQGGEHGLPPVEAPPYSPRRSCDMTYAPRPRCSVLTSLAADPTVVISPIVDK